MSRFNINEELSISNIVTDMCKELSYQLINKLKNNNKKIVQNSSRQTSKWPSLGKMVAYALYLSSKTEQDAFLSQFYAYLSSDNFYDNDPMKDKENPYYQFDRAFDAVDNLNFSETQLKQSFGLTVNQLYHILESADERLFKKMSHVWQKYNYDTTRNSINTKQTNFMLECFDNGIEEVESDIIW